MRHNIFSKITGLLLFFTTLHASAQDNALDAAITQAMGEHKAVGLSVAVIRNNKMVYTKAFGSRNIEQKSPLASTDMFRIASISKSFTATAIMRLVEQNKLNLDDDFSKLVGFKVRNPRFPDKIITLKMILSHTSSINDSQGYFNFDAIDPAKGANVEKCYNDYEPGKGYQYCNLNYNMAGAVIEKITGVRFDQFIKKEILDPLKLTGGYEVNALDTAKFAMLYTYNATTGKFTPAPAAYDPRKAEIENYQMGVTTPLFSPTGGMKISAPDLAKYMRMHMNYGKYPGGRLIKTASSKTMQTPYSDKEAYGLALLVNKTIVPGKTLIGHTGSAYGLHSAMFFDPLTKNGFVIITNGCNVKIDYPDIVLIKEVAGIIDRQLFK